MAHLFGTGSGYVLPDTARAIDKALSDAGLAAKINTHEYAEGGHGYWFSTENRGAPFDRQAERAVRQALEAADLWPVPTFDGLLAEQYRSQEPPNCEDCDEYGAGPERHTKASAVVWSPKTPDDTRALCSDCADAIEGKPIHWTT